MKALLTIAILTLVLPGYALAWGSEGHRIAAEIAEQYLTPATARELRELLTLDNATTLAEVSTWADDIRSQRPETAPWHYVKIPIHPPAGAPEAYYAPRDCPQGECVVAKIEEMAAVLPDKAAPPRERLEALKFLVHLVADVHQPLHAADDDDQGGAEIRVTFLGRATNLQAVWDTEILAPAVDGDERAYALGLMKMITTDEAETWRSGSPADWANESHALAVALIYGRWSHELPELPASYGKVALPVVTQQLKKAGVRLAAVLNTALS